MPEQVLTAMHVLLQVAGRTVKPARRNSFLKAGQKRYP